MSDLGSLEEWSGSSDLRIPEACPQLGEDSSARGICHSEGNSIKQCDRIQGNEEEVEKESGPLCPDCPEIPNRDQQLAAMSVSGVAYLLSTVDLDTSTKHELVQATCGAYTTLTGCAESELRAFLVSLCASSPTPASQPVNGNGGSPKRPNRRQRKKRLSDAQSCGNQSKS